MFTKFQFGSFSFVGICNVILVKVSYLCGLKKNNFILISANSTGVYLVFSVQGFLVY